jgi:hypothetical protein
MIIIMIVVKIPKIIGVIAIVSLLTITSVAQDYEYLNDNNILWESTTITTLNWTSPMVMAGEYQIEARDFNWLGSVSIRVTKNDIVKDGILSEGESYLFDFSRGSTFEGVEIVADQVSNKNSWPTNIGTYPEDPRAKISYRFPVPENMKKPSPVVSITTEGEQKAGSKITAFIKIENSGKSDLIDPELIILFDDLEPLNEYDFGVLSEGTVYIPEMKWKNASAYTLTPMFPNTFKNGFYIKVLNFSNNITFLSATYNLSTKYATLMEDDSIIFDFPDEKEYKSLKIIGKKIKENSVEFMLQFPEKNSLKRSFPVILKESEESVKLSFSIPKSSRKKFMITAKALGKDHEGNLYSASNSAKISIPDTFKIGKTVSNSILGERIYPESNYLIGNIRTIKNITHVMILVENHQNYPVYGVQLIDTIPPGFMLIEDTNRTSLLWNFDIKANDNKEFTYSITARRAGVHILPGAEITWNEGGETNLLVSNAPEAQVSGPYIVMQRSFNKSTVSQDDILQVSLSIINNGNFPTKIMVTDILPENATLLSGKVSFSGVIRPGEVTNIVYNILINEGIIEFHDPEITSQNTGFEWYAPVPAIKIPVLSPSPVPVVNTPAIPPEVPVIVPDRPPDKEILESISEQFPWLESAIAVVTLLFGISLLILMNRVW